MLKCYKSKLKSKNFDYKYKEIIALINFIYFIYQQARLNSVSIQFNKTIRFINNINYHKFRFKLNYILKIY